MWPRRLLSVRYGYTCGEQLRGVVVAEVVPPEGTSRQSPESERQVPWPPRRHADIEREHVLEWPAAMLVSYGQLTHSEGFDIGQGRGIDSDRPVALAAGLRRAFAGVGRRTPRAITGSSASNP